MALTKNAKKTSIEPANKVKVGNLKNNVESKLKVEEKKLKTSPVTSQNKAISKPISKTAPKAVEVESIKSLKKNKIQVEVASPIVTPKTKQPKAKSLKLVAEKVEVKAVLTSTVKLAKTPKKEVEPVKKIEVVTQKVIEKKKNSKTSLKSLEKIQTPEIASKSSIKIVEKIVEDEDIDPIAPQKGKKTKNTPIDPDDLTVKRAKKLENLSPEDELLVQKIYAEDLDLLPAKLAKKSKKLKMLNLDSIVDDDDVEPDLDSLPDINESDFANVDMSAIPGLQSLISDKTRGSKAAMAKEQALIAAAIKNDTMKVYMQDIGQNSLVSKAEEIDLAAKIHGFDDSEHDMARNTLILANLRLVVKIAHDFKGLGLPLLDLISEGNIGLMRAVEKFDPAKGAKFSSYAAWWIKQSMRRALANQSRTIRIPVQSAGKINKIKTARMKLSEDLGREPTDGEIAEFLTFSERTVSGLRLSDPRTFSIHDPIQQGEDGEFQDIIPDRGAMTPDRILGDIESVERLRSLLDKLEDREQQIITMRFGLTPSGRRPLTLEEVSQEIGRTRERVRQIQNQALTKLRELLWDEAGFVNE